MSTQNHQHLRPVFFITGLLIAVLALGCSSHAQGLQRGTPQGLPAAQLPSAEPYSYVYLDPLEASHQGARADDGQHQSFQLHGHWVVDVKNPDGTIAQHRDFENSIQGGGAAFLFGLMAGYAVPANYEIFLQSTGTAPCTPPGTLQGCVIVNSLTTSPGSNSCPNYACFLGLTTTFNLNYSVLASNSMVLAGSFTATRAGTIDNVSTYVGTCPTGFIGSGVTTQNPSTCQTQNGGIGVNALSAASITSVPVVQSQIVQVTVTISFS